MAEDVRCGDGDLWITEGIKKADALTGRGLPTVGIIGVWNWQREGRMIPCWDHVALDGPNGAPRRVYVVFDSDVMDKPEVQLALERLVGALQERGADVLVCYLPSEAGSGQDEDKVGVDDFLSTGRTVEELVGLARKFEPSDIVRVRLSKDQKLRSAVEDLERRWWAEEWKGMGGHTDRDVALKLVEAAGRNGKVVEGGVGVRPR